MQRTQTICLVMLTTIAVGFSLFYLKSVLLPFIIAMFVVIGCRPILELFEKRLKLHRMLAFAVTFMVGVLLLTMSSFLIWMSVNDLARNSAQYEARLSAIVVWVSESMPDSDGSETGPTLEAPQVEGDGFRENVSDHDPSAAMRQFMNSASSHMQRFLLNLAGSLSSLLSYGILILIFVFFLLLGDDNIHKQSPEILVEVESQIRKYLVMKTVISFLTGFTFGLVLWLFGVPLAIVFGLLAFLLNFIPNIGPLIASVLPVPFLVLNSEMDPGAAIVCFILISTIQFVSGNVIETRLMGKSFDVSPVVLLIALMFFGLVWGIVGMFLATPIVSILKIVVGQSSAGKPVAELMAGRWVVSESKLN